MDIIKNINYENSLISRLIILIFGPIAIFGWIIISILSTPFVLLYSIGEHIFKGYMNNELRILLEQIGVRILMTGFVFGFSGFIFLGQYIDLGLKKFPNYFPS